MLLPLACSALPRFALPPCSGVLVPQAPQHRAESMQLQERTTVASHSLTPQQAAEQHKVDAQSGLSSSEAAQRLALHGPNCARHAHLCPSLRALPGL